MESVRQLGPDWFWVGGSDRRLALFENMFPLPDGVAYNAYLLVDEKTVLIDTVDAAVTGRFLRISRPRWTGGLSIFWWSTIWSRITAPTSRPWRPGTPP